VADIRSIFRSGPLAPPYLTGLLLLSMIAIAGFRATPQLATDAYMQRVSETIGEIPYRVGAKIGTDAEISQPASKLLRPNKILQRRYTDYTTGETVSLIVVHCGEVRDMIGHYPPHCYPANGWTAVGSEDVSVAHHGQLFPARFYRFVKPESGLERRLDLLSFFVVPESTTPMVPDMDALERVSQSFRRNSLGAAQVQIMIPSDATPEERDRIAAEYMNVLEPTIRVIAAGVTDEQKH
jgi:hypothetical protein